MTSSAGARIRSSLADSDPGFPEFEAGWFKPRILTLLESHDGTKKVLFGVPSGFPPFLDLKVDLMSGYRAGIEQAMVPTFSSTLDVSFSATVSG